MHSHSLRLFSFAAFAALAAVATTSQAQGVVSMPAGQASVSQASSLPDFRHARTVLPQLRTALPTSAFDLNTAMSIGSRQPVEGGEAGGRGGADARGEARKLFDVSPDEVQEMSMTRDSQVTPQAVGTQGLQFTSSQVYPSDADTTYPTRATGKLWFQISGAWYVCSGTMIKPGIVLTAGHCVASGTGSWYTSFQFVPGYRNGAAPYGIWTSWATATTTSEWFSGGGGVPNGGDYALIVFNKNASNFRIGDYTGWFGYQYPSLIGKHVSVLGYPQNIDSGVVNHRIDAQTTSGSNNTGLWGSDMRGGSSGGGVVLNLQKSYTISTSQPQDNGSNRLVGAVSYGPTADGPMYQGGSVFDSRISTMVNNMCASYAWAC
jgi:V8-like Glu-specific endopeptidase